MILPSCIDLSKTLVSNHFHSVKSLLFSSARPRDFDGMLSTELPVSMYTTKTPIDMRRFNFPQLKEFLTFSVKDRYQLHYFIYIKNFNAETITSLKLNLFSSFRLYLLLLSASWRESDLSWYISVIRQTVRCCTPAFSQPFSWRLHITIAYNLPHLRLWYIDVVTVIA